MNRSIPSHRRIAMLSVHSSPLGRLGSRDTGGMSVYVRSLARELGQRGHPVDIFTRHPEGRSGPCVDPLGHNVRLIQLKAGDNGYSRPADLYPHLESFFESLERFRASEALRYDLIHSHYWLSGRVGAWAQREWGVPHAVMFHTLGAAKNGAQPGEEEPPVRLRTEADLARTCHRIVAATPRERRDLQRLYGVDPQRIRVVPCGVDLDLFRPLDREVSRRKLDLDRHDAVVLFVGRFSPIKGLERLLEAAALLRDYPGLRLVIVGGEGPEAPPEPSRRAAELGIDRLTRFAGQVDHRRLPEFYSAADVLVVPSHYESFGLVCLEALACGTPVVSTAVGVMEDIIVPGETGCVLPDGSPELLARCLLGTLRGAGGNPGAREKARASVAGFSWSRVASTMLEQYTELVEEFGR
ncbi:MAG: glycosyltransferase [Syntrophobacteraceae bacterium]|jgi:D-inositol-3-phosphate glycosyltransferase|nr:glycosyltransferase [Syntrophobacteraceae bacterium]